MVRLPVDPAVEDADPEVFFSSVVFEEVEVEDLLSDVLVPEDAACPPVVFVAVVVTV